MVRQFEVERFLYEEAALLDAVRQIETAEEKLFSLAAKNGTTALLNPRLVTPNVKDTQGGMETDFKAAMAMLTELDDLPVYHPDVRVFEVKEADGSMVAIWYSDYFPRESKRGGAWMSSFRKQYYEGDERVLPIIYNVGNFTKPTAETPALLSADEVGTMFHEFGHALHGILSDVRYRTLSGTAVARDFVEMPSQVIENWAFEREVLDLFANHWKTGEKIPAELVDKLEKSQQFNQGFETTEYTASAIMDMKYHTMDPSDLDVDAFEREALAELGLPGEIVMRHRSPHFTHAFSGEGYSAGYYSYDWAEVIVADAAEAFAEAPGGFYDPEVAAAISMAPV